MRTMYRRFKRIATNEKGFTLVELMAVLTILAIIIAIAVPAIGSIIEKGKKSADETSIELMEDAGEKAYVDDRIDFDGPEPESYTIPKLIEEGYLKLDEDHKFNKPENYVVKKNDGGEFIFNGTGQTGGDSEPPESTDENLFEWEYVDGVSGDRRIIGYLGTDTDIVLPSTIEGDTVTEVGNGSFYGAGFTSLYIPDSVTALGMYAFANNPLTSLRISPNMSRIENGSFSNSTLTAVTIPEGVVVIGDGAFSGTDGQETRLSVTLPSSLETIENYAFQRANLSDVSFSGESQLVTIGDGAFSNASLGSFIFPSTLRTIGERAFEFNGLSSIALPTGLETIQGYAFMENPISTVRLPASITTIGTGAFGGLDIQPIIRGVVGSEAEAYASREFYEFIAE